jgi:hypothetical protein
VIGSEGEDSSEDDDSFLWESWDHSSVSLFFFQILLARAFVLIDGVGRLLP